MAARRDKKGRFVAGGGKIPKGFKKGAGGNLVPTGLGVSTRFGKGSSVRVTKVGQWAEASKILKSGPFAVPAAIMAATRQEAEVMRKLMIRNLSQQGNLAGAPFLSHSSATKLTRKFRRRPTGKVLIDTAQMRNSITVKQKGLEVFVGILRTSRGKDGRPLANIARVHEFGQTIAVPVTRAMLRFLHTMYAKGGKKSSKSTSTDKMELGSTMLIRIPARPFIQPVVDKFYSNPAVVRARFNARVGFILGGAFGTVVAGGGIIL